MEYTLPKLAYAYDALEPYFDTQTMEIHHTKHHQVYIQNLNAALAKEPVYAQRSLEDLLSNIPGLPESLQKVIQNHGGGHYNHTFFWTILNPRGGGLVGSELESEISKTFGSFATFQEDMNVAAKSVFGSGWAWLVFDKNTGGLRIMTTPNQDTPLMHHALPIIGLDVWEHAYYLKYQNRRPDYIDAWWHVINWSAAQDYYAVAKK